MGISRGPQISALIMPPSVDFQGRYQPTYRARVEVIGIGRYAESSVVLVEAIPVGLVADHLDLVGPGAPTEDGRDPVGASKLLTVLIEYFEDLPRGQRSIGVRLREHGADPLELAASRAHTHILCLLVLQTASDDRQTPRRAKSPEGDSQMRQRVSDGYEPNTSVASSKPRIVTRPTGEKLGRPGAAAAGPARSGRRSATGLRGLEYWAVWRRASPSTRHDREPSDLPDGEGPCLEEQTALDTFEE